MTVLLSQSALLRGDETPPAISFAQDIHPILSEHCFHCCGHDANTREADLRLDVQQTFVSDGQSARIVVAGKPDESELLRRISSADNEERMPPADAGEKLSAKKIESIRQWIAAGAVWQQHWAFTKPKRPMVPSTGDNHWSKNEIDHFILRCLQHKKLLPSPGADKQTLFRRVSLDLTGLPPTLEEVNHFLSDQRPDAYERLVNLLLASPRYGEQMAATWRATPIPTATKMTARHACGAGLTG